MDSEDWENLESLINRYDTNSSVELGAEITGILAEIQEKDFPKIKNLQNEYPWVFDQLDYDFS